MLRKPKLLDGLSEAASEGASSAAADHVASVPSSGAGIGSFRALMSRMQADIIEASDWDIISSPQADLMRSIIGRTLTLHALPRSSTWSHI